MDNIIPLFDPRSSTFTYIVFNASTQEAAIIDAVDAHLKRDLAVLSARKLDLKWAIEPDAHADHITAAGEIVRRTGAETATPSGCGIGRSNRHLADGDTMF